ncbi:MAG TPA: hypothetical protein VFF88_11175, partial [Methylocella sp.]|nr:hypothetical protein [Methylocella sp.]
DFADRVFKRFKQRGNPKLAPQRGRAARAAPLAVKDRESVSEAVKRSLHVVNALSAAKNLHERRLLGLLICSPHLVERYSEALAWIAFEDPQLDRLRRELLNVAASGKRLDKSAIEDHLVRQGFSTLAERLTTHSVLQSDLRGQADEEARAMLWTRTRAQLADPEIGGAMPDAMFSLKARRDVALKRYLDSGASEDWEELQRLNAEMRATLEADGRRDVQ